MTIPDALIQLLVQGRVVPFVGSGVSLGVKPDFFPTWKGLIGKLADKLVQETKTKHATAVRSLLEVDEVFDAANKAVNYLGPAHFRDVVKQQFAVARPADANLAVPNALWALQPKLVVTTNYDKVLQWSHPAAQPILNHQKANLAELFSRAVADPPIVWHLHGHIDNPDSLILTPEQYKPLYSEARDDKHSLAAAWQQLRTLISGHPLLFIGFGLQDEYVMGALRSMLEIFEQNLRPSYALLKKGDGRADTLWNKHNIQAIEYEVPADNDHGPPLVALLTEMLRLKTSVPPNSLADDAGPAMIPAAYVEWLSLQCEDITRFSMAPARGQSVSLQQVYVPPLTSVRFEEEALAEAASPGGLGGKRKRGGRKKSTPLEMQEESGTEVQPQLLLNVLGERSLYVSGDSGSGKSTFCRWLAWLVAKGDVPDFAVPPPDEYRETLPETLKGRLPVLVPLRDFHDELPRQPGRRSLTADQFQPALQRWLDKTKPGGLTWSVVAPHLAKGSLLLILDGIDEVPASVGVGTEAWSPLEALLAGWSAVAVEWMKRSNRMLVTSRPYGLSPDQVRSLDRIGLPEARLEPLPEALQDLLAARWFVALPKPPTNGRDTARAMLQEVRKLSDDVAVLAANPLLLTAICIIYGDGKELPKDKHDLYHRIVNAALSSRYLRDPRIIEPVRARLAAVALGMHTGQPHEPTRSAPVAEVSYAELDQILRVYIGANPETESGFTDQVEARCELLTKSGLLSEKASERAGFFHLSFQEFLAAEQLARLHHTEAELLDVFLQRAEQARWRPTLKFLFGRRVVDPGVRAALDLLGKIVDSIDTQRVAERLGLALSAVDALDILRSRSLNLQEPLLARFREIACAAIDQHVELKPRAELGRMLGRIGDPRVVDDIRDPAAWVKVAAGKYRVGDSKLAEEFKKHWLNVALPDETVPFEQPFLLSKYPVTNAQFQHFVDAQGYGNESLWLPDGWKWRTDNSVQEPWYWQDSKWNGPTQPVVGVSWWEADAFCRWADCRLPTEREWEAAARGPDGRTYPWGGEWRDGICNSDEAGLEVTTPVGIFPESAAICGAHDMAGNVWEWCQDWYAEKLSGGPDPSGPLNASDRVFRGGSWRSSVGYGNLRSAERGRISPEDRGYDLGFRVACSSGAQSPAAGGASLNGFEGAEPSTESGVEVRSLSGAKTEIPERKTE